AQNLDADVPGETVIDGRTFQEKIGLRFVDDEVAQLELRQRANGSARIAADAFADAIFGLTGCFRQLMGFDKFVTEAQPAIASGVDLELARHRRLPRPFDLR